MHGLKSPLGVATSVFAEIENPTATKTFIKITNENPEQFIVKSANFKL
jgi:hypothetical protein